MCLISKVEKRVFYELRLMIWKKKYLKKFFILRVDDN